jgi:hypothetical protein
MKTTTVQLGATIRDGLKQLIKDNDEGSNITNELNQIVHSYIMSSGLYLQTSNGYAKKGDTLLITDPTSGTVTEAKIKQILDNIVHLDGSPGVFFAFKVNQLEIKQ